MFYRHRISPRPLRLSALLALLLVFGCTDEPEEHQAGIPPAAPDSTPVDSAATAVAAKPEPRVLADWRSYSFNPPRYGTERLLIKDDQSCMLLVAADDSQSPCSWQHLEDDRIEISFPASGRSAVARLQGPKSIEGRELARATGYLVVDLDENRRQLFVLSGSPDADMVLETIEGERAWRAGRHGPGIFHLREATDAGSVYARLRLGWIYASSAELGNPGEALRLLEPLQTNQVYNVQNALAAAYAANDRFAEATATAEIACKLADDARRAGCLKRLEQYRAGTPLSATPSTE